MLKQGLAAGWLALAMALPVQAQDEVPPAEEAAAEPAAEPVAEDSSSSDSSSDSSGSEGEGGGEGLKLYAGVEYDMTTVDINSGEVTEALGASRFDSNFYKLRLGVRAFESVGVELHAGVPDNSASRSKLKTSEFYGLYFVPTGVFMEVLEVSARIGYASTKLKSQDLGSETLDGMSFGLSFELPLRTFAEGMPDIRLTTGGTVYQEDRDARVYGFHGGLRYDFQL